MSQVISVRPANVERTHGPVGEYGDPAIDTGAVYVVHTSVDETLVAVRVAGEFAGALGVPVKLLHFRTIPYPLALDAPCGVSPVETDAFTERLRAEDFDIDVRVHLCRDELRAIPLAIKKPSLVVMAGHRSWWLTRSEQRRRALEAAGNFVVLVDTSKHRTEDVRHAPRSERIKEQSHA